MFAYLKPMILLDIFHIEGAKSLIKLILRISFMLLDEFFIVHWLHPKK